MIYVKQEGDRDVIRNKAGDVLGAIIRAEGTYGGVPTVGFAVLNSHDQRIGWAAIYGDAESVAAGHFGKFGWTPDPDPVEYKLGHHRGRRRIWLDGKRPAEHGFMPGVHYAPVFTNHPNQGPELTLVVGNFDKARKVTGKGEKPVIDLNGQDITDFFAGCATVLVTFQKNRIIIRKGKPE